MKDQYKTKQKLIGELVSLRKQVVRLGKKEKNRKRIEETLRESEDRYRSLFSNSLDAVLLTSPDGTILEANAEACRMFGYTEEGLRQIGRDGVADTSDPRLPIALEERKRTGRFGGGLNLIRKDGTKFPAEISSSVFKDKDGNLRTSMIIRDITERKQMEEALRRKSEEQELLLDNIDARIWYLTDAETYGAVNRGYANFYGREKKDLEGKKQWDILRKDEAEVCIAGNREVFEKKRKHYSEEWLTNSKGEKRFHSIIKTPKIDDDGNVKYVFCVATDITEQKQVEEALRRRGEEIHMITDNVPGLVSYVDEKGYYRFVSKRYEEWFGVQETEIIGKHLRQVLGETTYELIKGYVETVLSGRQVHFEESLPYAHGGVRWVVAEYVPDMDDRGKVKGFFALVTDITERKQAEEERERLLNQVRAGRERLRSLAQRLVEIQEVERRDLVRRLHDEVGQNLTGLSINLNILRSQMPDEMTTKTTTRIDDSLKLVEETVERIRDVMAELRPPVLDDYGVAAALHWYGNQFSERTGIATVLELDELSARLPSHWETALFRIAQEALTNVAKYAHAKTVTVMLEEFGDSVRLTIADDGVGFDPQTHHQPGAKPEWGLMNMRERAQAIGGKLSVETAPGKGTKIIVEIKR
jgi:PAS domain S-box-containing protein